MATVHVINASNSVNCGKGVVLKGVNCTQSWSPYTFNCPTVIASGWLTRWDDVCYYTTCSGGV